MIEYLFVYGTLRSEFKTPIGVKFRQNSQLIASASIAGLLYEVDNYPGAIATDKHNLRIKGELYRLCNISKQLIMLDEYEDCGVNFPEPHEYKRQITQVETEDKNRIQAWVYYYNLPVDNLIFIASGDYVQFRNKA